MEELFKKMQEGMHLAVEISKLKEKVEEFLKENYEENVAVLIFSAGGELGSVCHKYMGKAVKKMLDENPDLAERLQKEGISAERIKNITDAAKDEDPEVDFEPVK